MTMISNAEQLVLVLVKHGFKNCSWLLHRNGMTYFFAVRFCLDAFSVFMLWLLSAEISIYALKKEFRLSDNIKHIELLRLLSAFSVYREQLRVLSCQRTLLVLTIGRISPPYFLNECNKRWIIPGWFFVVSVQSCVFVLLVFVFFSQLSLKFCISLVVSNIFNFLFNMLLFNCHMVFKSTIKIRYSMCMLIVLLNPS